MSSSSRRPTVAAAVLFLGCFLLYANTIPHGYNIDDETVTRDHPLTAQGLRAIPKIFTTPHFDYGGQAWEYRPLTRATFAVEHALFGANPHVSHFFNVLLYALTAVVLYRFLRVICGSASPELPFIAAALFAAHPLHTEVVASIKSRDEILALLFALISASWFLRLVHRRDLATAIAAGATLLLALMSKLSAVTFVALIPLSMAFYRPARLRPAAVTAVALILGLGAYVGAVTTLVGSFGKESTFVEIPLWNERDPLIVLGAVVSSLLFYAHKLVAPAPFGFIYGYAVFEPISILSPRAAVSVAIHAALAAYAVFGLRRRSNGAFGAGWYLIAIVPFSVVYGLVGERFTYVASVGFAVMLAAAVAHLRHVDAVGARPLATAALAAAIAAGSIVTVQRNGDWKDTTTLCDADLPNLQRSALAHYICSRDLRRTFGPRPSSAERTDNLRKAIHLASRAIAIYPGYAAAHAHVGAMYLYDLDQPEAACPFLWRASDLGARYAAAHYDALWCSIATGRFDEAMGFATRLVREEPDHQLGLFYLSKLHFRRGELDEALRVNDRLARLAPDRDLAYLNYGYFHYELGDTEGALENLRRALAIAPDNPPVQRDLAAVEAESMAARSATAPVAMVAE